MDDREARARLGRHLRMIEHIASHTEVAIPTNLSVPESELALDDEALRPYQLSHYVANSITTAVDVMSTARLVMDFQGGLRVPVVGIYPLMRSALEASALAVWLLYPDEPQVRRARAIAVRWTDIVHDDNLAGESIGYSADEDRDTRAFKQKALRENTRRVRGRKNKLRGVADRLGIEIEPRPGFGPILGDTAEYVGLPASHLRGTYGTLSGLTHPSLAGTLRMSAVNQQARDADGTLLVNISADLSTVAFATDAAILLYMNATKALQRRTGLEGIKWPPRDAARRFYGPE